MFSLLGKVSLPTESENTTPASIMASGVPTSNGVVIFSSRVLASATGQPAIGILEVSLGVFFF